MELISDLGFDSFYTVQSHQFFPSSGVDAPGFGASEDSAAGSDRPQRRFQLGNLRMEKRSL